MTERPVTMKPSVPTPLSGFDFTQAWLDGNTAALEALPKVDTLLTQRMDALTNAAWAPWDSAEIAELKAFNMAAGNYGGAELCDRLSDPSALVVVTGQQPNLLASPLYILYKALSAVAWSRQLSEWLDRVVTPVFWVASDDDDFTELKQAWLPAWSGELVNAGRRIARGEHLGAGSPAYRWNLADSEARLAEDIKAGLAGWPGGEETVQWLLDEIAAEPNFERSFCRLLAKLLGDDFPMIFVTPRLTSMRRRGAKVLADDVAQHSAINIAVSDKAQDFNDRGYPVSLAREPEALNSFWLHDGRRCRLLRTGGAGAAEEIVAIDPASHKTVGHFSETELLARLSSHPEEFAPNVVTRPVVQDTALPTLLYVAGPGELAYLAVLGEAYNKLVCTRSAVTPRSFVTLGNELAIDGQLSEPNAGELLSDGSSAGAGLLDEINLMQQELTVHFARMETMAGANRAGISEAIAKTDQHIRRGIDQMKRRLARQVAQQAWEAQARKVALLAPAGKPQERMLAPWTFVDAGRLDALAHYVYAQADFTTPGPHQMPLPPWLSGTL